MTTPARRGWELVCTDPFSPDYHPTFTGNGFFAARVPAAGQGFAAHPVPTQFQVAGLFGDASPFQVRAGAPAWTTLELAEAGGAFSSVFAAESPAGAVEDYRQVLDLATGTITTSARWLAPSGAAYTVRYTLFTDRENDERAVVRLDVSCDRDAEIVVSDVLDARSATLAEGFSSLRVADSATVTLVTALRGTGLSSVVASTLRGPGVPAQASADALHEHSVGQTLTASLRAGESASFAKYVGVQVIETADAAAAARAGEVSRAAAEEGADAVRAGNDRAWRKLWRGDIRVAGDDLLQEQIRASRFYLLASVNARRPWSPSPAGLSSDGYGGHAFWDTETWMWPSLLMSDPDIAKAVLQYRADRAGDAATAAAAGGDAGIRFPWEGALDGFEHTPAVEFGETELHIISDVALACWQYHVVTGDLAWLASTGADIIFGAADFWAGRARRDADGAFHLAHVTPPDEWAQAHDDSAYTNVAAARVCGFAVRTAELLDREPRDAWRALAEHPYVPYDEERGVVREHADYKGQRIKQADVVMLTYPWQHPQDPALTARNLDYYASKVTEWGGPSMTDAMHAIVSAELGRSEDALWYTRRSAAPFLRPPFQQFAEERDGGAFTFVTGAGGFLQIFLYGFSGLRLREDAIELAPILPERLEGITLTGLRWHGSTFDVHIGPAETIVTVTDGGPVPVLVGAARHEARPGAPIAVPTRPSVDRGPARGHGELLARAEFTPEVLPGPPPGFPADTFEATAVELFRAGSDLRVVTTFAGELANPWAGEGLSAQELHVYLIDETAPRVPARCLPPLEARTAQPWRVAVVGSGLRGGPGGDVSGTGVYDPSGGFLGRVRLTVARRREVVLTLPEALLEGADPTAMRIAVAVLDASGGLPPTGDAPYALPVPRPVTFGVPTSPGASPLVEADGAPTQS